jgi:hypothetical protein
MKSKTSIVIFVIVIIIAAIFLVLDQVHAPTTSISATSSTIVPIVNQGQTAGSTSTSTTSPAIDMSSWKIYSNAQPAFNIKYPADLAFSTSTIPTIAGPYLLALQFPKEIYFSTVLKDEAYVIVTASSTCPVVEQGPIDKGPTMLDINGVTFTENTINDAAAGNRYLTMTYDTIANNLCYRITFFDHGTDGAGFYLSDTDAINAADKIHDAELSKTEAIAAAMLGTFNTGVVSVPR